MEATVTFRGVACASVDPVFVDQCLDLLRVNWTHAEPLTLHFYPSGENFYSLHASIAWRGEVFAYAFPTGTGNTIALGQQIKEEKAHDHFCPGADAKRALAVLLDVHLIGRVRDKEQFIAQAGKDRDMLRDIIAQARSV